MLEKSEIFRLSEILRRRSGIFITYLYKNALFFLQKNVLLYKLRNADCKFQYYEIDMISELLDAQMLLSEAKMYTALHAMQTRSSDENSVCPSVKRVHCDKTEERSVQIIIPYKRIFSPVFWEEEWVGGGDPFYLKFWVYRPPLERNRRFSTDIRL